MTVDGGGVVVDAGTFPWDNGNFPQMTEPTESYGGISWWGNFAEYGFLTKLRSEQLRDIGASLSPHSAFLLIQGVETLPQRMREHVVGQLLVRPRQLDAGMGDPDGDGPGIVGGRRRHGSKRQERND